MWSLARSQQVGDRNNKLNTSTGTFRQNYGYLDMEVEEHIFLIPQRIFDLKIKRKPSSSSLRYFGLSYTKLSAENWLHHESIVHDLIVLHISCTGFHSVSIRRFSQKSTIKRKWIKEVKWRREFYQKFLIHTTSTQQKEFWRKRFWFRAHWQKYLINFH